MGLDRRTFLQQAGLALVSLGISETAINLLGKNSRWLKPYVETLAQTTNRKLALLVGINEYSAKANLHGCLNDVELQKELLIHCFGFKPQDIYTLTNRQATRENIETAFTEYLVEQAQNGDVVLFHFSGYGSQVKVSHNTDTTQYQLVNSLVPVNGTLSTKANPAANDLLQDTFLALGRSLTTPNFITVLDTSFQTSKATLQGNYRIRSYSQVASRPSPEELAFQEQLKRKIAGKGITSYFKATELPGVILAAAKQNQIALEGTWNGFSAGLLTYALTRYLWQTPARNNLQIALQQTANNVNNWSAKQQKPQISGKANSNLGDTNTLSRGEGFVASSESKAMFVLKLTALSPVLLDTYGEESCFRVVDRQNLLQVRSRLGITAKAQLLEKTTVDNSKSFVGQLIQEAIRVLPKNQGLSVALDDHLERIEKVDATSAFANLISVKTTVNAGETYADCLLGKTSLMVDKTVEADPQKTTYSYGLYTSEGDLITHTSGEANEVVKLAIKRLEPDFTSLLAAKWLELTVNENSSQIPVTATLELASKNIPLQQKASLRVITNTELTKDLPTIEQSSPIKLKITNNSDRDLYGILVGVDEEYQVITLYNPTAATNIPDNLIITASSQLIIPQANNTWQWKVNQSVGLAKMYLILATQPFTKTIKSLPQEATTKLERQNIINVSHPLNLTQAILQDLHNSSAVDSTILNSNTDVYALDVNHWASFQFIYNVI